MSCVSRSWMRSGLFPDLLLGAAVGAVAGRRSVVERLVVFVQIRVRLLEVADLMFALRERGQSLGKLAAGVLVGCAVLDHPAFIAADFVGACHQRLSCLFEQAFGQVGAGLE